MRARWLRASSPHHDAVAAAASGCLERVVVDRVHRLAGGELLVDGWALPCRDGGGLVVTDASEVPTEPAPAPLLRKPRPDVSESLGREGGSPLGFVGCLPSVGPRVGAVTIRCSHGAARTLSVTEAPASRDPAELLVNAVWQSSRLHDQVRAHVAPVVRDSISRQAAPTSEVAYRSSRLTTSARINVVVPLYRNFSYLRNQLHFFARGHYPDLAITLVCDDPALSEDLVAWVIGWNRVYEAPVQVVTHDVNAGFAAACNTGWRAVSSDVSLLLNSDVLPGGDASWCEALLQELRTGAVAAAPLLTYPDGSIQHAGMAMGAPPSAPDFSMPLHTSKGLPLKSMPSTPFAVPLLSGATLAMETVVLDKVGGVPTWLGKGDFEDVALCHRLLEYGELRVVPAVCWTHFEGASYDRSGGSAWLMTLAKSLILEDALRTASAPT